MSINISRRELVRIAGLGLAALSSPTALLAFTGRSGFTHGVASGEPSQDSVLLWTRYVSESGSDASLQVEISPTMDFASITGGASVSASPARNGCTKAVISGLVPGRWYFYRFIAPDGSVSPIGRTRTLPEGEVARLSLAVFSCSNLPFGWFNAYAHASARDDVDMTVHLGDYIYEYGAGTYPSAQQALPGRRLQPDHEIVTLEDYRLRYAAYRADNDLQRLHQLYPMVAMWDDHEFANDVWMNGAQNHQSDSEGDWQMRKRIAEQVWREWMPVRDIDPGAARWADYQIGNLATIFRTESRITGRDEQLNMAAALTGQSDIQAALKHFRDDLWLSPERHMLGAEQAAWFGDALRRSKQSGTRWQVWAQQCVMGSLKTPSEIAGWIPDNAPDYVKSRARVGHIAASLGLPFNMDSWDGYPVARRNLLQSAMDAEANLVVLSGDSHNGWAFDLDVDGTPAGVEFAGNSVTSPGFESYLPGVSPAEVAKALVTSNEQLKWTDTSQRGYMTVTLEPDSAASRWHFVDDIRSRSIKLASEVQHSVTWGRNRLNNA